MEEKGEKIVQMRFCLVKSKGRKLSESVKNIKKKKGEKKLRGLP